MSEHVANNDSKPSSIDNHYVFSVEQEKPVDAVNPVPNVSINTPDSISENHSENTQAQDNVQAKLKEEDFEQSKKHEFVSKLSDWWQHEKDKLSQDDTLKFFQDNKQRMNSALSNIHHNNFFYRCTNAFFAFVSMIAGWIDKTKDFLMKLFLKLPAPSVIKNFLRSTLEAVNFKGLVGFIDAKFYSLKKAPHHLPSIQLFEDMLAHAKKEGLDIKKYFPDLAKKYQKRKHQILQHSFFKEFAKNSVEKVLATPFSFNRSLSPVLPDTRLWHKFFDILERRHIKDLILVNEAGQRTSFKHDPKHLVDSSQVMQRLYQASLHKSSGRRVFIIGHHESYVGPYCVRSVLRRLGFENLAANCNTVVGPKMFSNIVLKNGASNVGNLFLTLPSQRTTAVTQKDLAEALSKTARCTQYLIKMPNSALHMLEGMNYNEFMNNLVRCDLLHFETFIDTLPEADKKEVNHFFETVRHTGAFDELAREDFDLFKQVMHEPFLLFPEGSRSYIDEQGDVTMKYVNPRYLEAYFRPGDVILPLNLVGGSDITKGWFLSVADMGLSVAEPFIVTESMIQHYQEEGLNVMKKIAALPNIKKVYFDEEIQTRIKSAG